MTINNGTKKIEAPPKEIPCTYYVGSSVGRISVVIRCEFFLVRTREFLLLWRELLCTKLFFVSLLLGMLSSRWPIFLRVFSESCLLWNIVQRCFTLSVDFSCMCLLCCMPNELLRDINVTTLEFTCSEYPSSWWLLLVVFICVYWWRFFFFVLVVELLFIILWALGGLRLEVVIVFMFSFLLCNYLRIFWI